MQVVTTRNKPKPFAWSYSRLKNFESCPKRHWHLDIQKDIKEEEGEALLWGNVVHKALADRVQFREPGLGRDAVLVDECRQPSDGLNGALEALAPARGLCTCVTVRAESDRKSTRLNSSHVSESRMPSSA